MTRIAITDYGCGNIQSIRNAFAKSGASAEIVSDPEHLCHFEKLVLPGVGAFSNAMARLNAGGFLPALENFRQSGKPILGICLGMQLLCTDSDEVPSDSKLELIPGLGWIKASVRHFKCFGERRLKVPHMGWNALHMRREHALYQGVEDQADVYFVHSHAVQCQNPDDVMTLSHYEHDFVSSFAKEHVYGMQFHPEKSHKVGLRILENFVRLAV